MNKAVNYGKGLLRASPLFINLTSIIYGMIFRSPLGVFFGVYAYSADILNHFSKKFFKNVVYNNRENIPLLGKGKRPNGAKYCGIFIDDNNLEGLATSFGMPSGHSHFAAILGVFWTMYIRNNSEDDLYQKLIIILILFISLSIMISRYTMGCHTPQQIIVGGLIGSIFGYIGYYLYNYLDENVFNF